MPKSFLSNLSLVVALNLLVKPLYLLGVEVTVQNRLGPESYGLYFALLNSAYLLQIINDYGVQIFNNRLVARDPTALPRLFSGLFGVKLVLVFVYILLVGVLGIVLGYDGFMGILLLIAINLSLTSFILFFRSGLSGLGFYRLDSLLSVLDKLLMILIIGGLLLFRPGAEFTIYHFVFGQMGALCITAAVALFILIRFGRFTITWLPVAQVGAFFRMAFPYAVIVFLMTIYTRIDGVMLLGLLETGAYEAGVYAAGYRILDAFNMVAFLFAGLLLPMFSRAHASRDQQRELLDQGFRYMWVLVFTVSVAFVSCRDEVMTLLYIGANPYWGRVFALLITNFIAMGMMYVFGTFLTAEGRVHTLMKIYATTVALNVLLNFILIPRYLAVGAAATTLATQFFAATGVLISSILLLRLTVSVHYLARVVLFSAGCLASAALAVWVFPNDWLFRLLGILSVSLLAGLATRMIRLSELLSRGH